MNEQPNTATSETSVTESVGNFRLEEWELSENSTEEQIPVIEGKIIARMPDLGTGKPANSESPTASPSTWDGLYHAWFSRSSNTTESGIQYQSPVSRQFRREQFFGRLISFGIGVLVCGVGILLIDRNDSEKPSGIEVTQAKGESTPVEVTVKAPESSAIVPTQNSTQVPVAAAPSASTEHASIPAESHVVARANEAVPATSAATNYAASPESPWSRPASDGYSPWATDTARRLDVASANPPYAENGSNNFASEVSMTHMAPIPSYQQTNGAVPVRPPHETMLYSPQTQPNYSRTHQLAQNPNPGYATNQGSVPQPNYGNQYDNQYNGQYNNQNYPAPPAAPNYTNYSTAQPVSNFPAAIPSGASTLQQTPYYQSQPATIQPDYHQQGTVPYRRVY